MIKYKYKYTANQLKAKCNELKVLHDTGLVIADNFICFCDSILGENTNSEIQHMDTPNNDTQSLIHNKSQLIYKSRTIDGYCFEIDMLGFFIKYGKRFLYIKHIENTCKEIPWYKFIKKYQTKRKMYKEFVNKISDKKLMVGV